MNNPSFLTIVRTTIDLAHQLGVKVVAEGVESEAVRSELHALGCDAAQGFLIGRPMPGSMFVNWLRDREQLSQRRTAAGHQTGLAAGISATDHDSTRAEGAWRRLARSGQLAVDRAGALTLATAAVMLIAYGLWQVFRWGGHRHQVLIGDLAILPVNVAATICAWRASLRKDLGRSTRRAWGLLAIALGLYLLGDILHIGPTTSRAATAVTSSSS